MMKSRRRDFLKMSGLTGLGLAGGVFGSFAATPSIADSKLQFAKNLSTNPENRNTEGPSLSMIGLFGPWAAQISQDKIPSLSFRQDSYTDPIAWQTMARKAVKDRMGIPDTGSVPEVKITREFEYDGLLIKEMQWQLPYGRPTEAILLKPKAAKSPLPGILAFHDHGGNKYFGKRKITKTSDHLHPALVAHQKEYYSGLAWANEIAKKGYAVLVPDAFDFASRRVMLQDVPVSIRQGLNDDDPENSAKINAYNNWAGQHEHIMAKSLFSAGTTWPAVFFAEDQKALDILCSFPEVDAKHVGCAGLSGGGLRTVFMGGLDPRIQCAVCVGFMTTWKDFLLYKSVNHTWMVYVPLLPNELDFPEILGMRIPLPTLVLNDEGDDLYTMPEMKRADSILAALFKKANAADRYKCSYYPGPHKFDAAMQAEAFAWFDRWLKNT
jgi:dienelactone hydrolase